MDEIYFGVVAIVTVVVIIRTINAYHNYKNTIYPEIYSGFFEFMIKKGSVKRLSESNWYTQNFGKHKLFYYVCDEKKKIPQLFVIIILQSGIYLVHAKNFDGQIFDKNKKLQYKTTFVHKKTKIVSHQVVDLPNLFLQTQDMQKRIEQLLNQKIKQSYITFLNSCEIKISHQDIPCLYQKELFSYLDQNKKDSVYTESQILQIYQLLVKHLS